MKRGAAGDQRVPCRAMLWVQNGQGLNSKCLNGIVRRVTGNPYYDYDYGTGTVPGRIFASPGWSIEFRAQDRRHRCFVHRSYFGAALFQISNSEGGGGASRPTSGPNATAVLVSAPAEFETTRGRRQSTCCQAKAQPHRR